jgi:PadR family transcriptional regulator PadR
MPRDPNPIEKEHALGYVLKVQQVIDFIVLSELHEGRRYHKELEKAIITNLDRVGVNDAYFSQRLKKLTDMGHLSRVWKDDNRYNRYYDITDAGRVYFNEMLRDLPVRVERALKVYTLFGDLIAKYDHVNLK